MWQLVVVLEIKHTLVLRAAVWVHTEGRIVLAMGTDSAQILKTNLEGVWDRAVPSKANGSCWFYWECTARRAWVVFLGVFPFSSRALFSPSPHLGRNKPRRGAFYVRLLSGHSS